MVQELAKRWWYALPSWPPVDYDYAAGLLEAKLRRVELSTWKLESEEENGLRRVVELDTYPGVFSDSEGTLYDLRPQANCPSLDNFRAKDPTEIKTLLKKALEEQVKELEGLET